MAAPGGLLRPRETHGEDHGRGSRPAPSIANRLALDCDNTEPPIRTDNSDRQPKAAARGSVRIELALLHRAYHLAVEKKKLGRGCVPVFPKFPADPASIRQGFLTRAEVEDDLSNELAEDLADVVQFLFFSTQRVSIARKIEWRHHDRTARAIRLPADLMKNKDGLVLPLEGELASIIERRLAKRRLDCPYVFHRNGKPIGDFRKAWRTACEAIGLPGRIVHDLRRSGVKHLIDAGNDPHTVMAFSGHKTASMLRRYHIINLDDLRRAALRGSAYTGTRTASCRSQTAKKSGRAENMARTW